MNRHIKQDNGQGVQGMSPKGSADKDNRCWESGEMAGRLMREVQTGVRNRRILGTGVREGVDVTILICLIFFKYKQKEAGLFNISFCYKYYICRH